MPADPKAEAAFAKFLANVPDAPSSALPHAEASETDPKAPATRDTKGRFRGAQEAAGSPPPAEATSAPGAQPTNAPAAKTHTTEPADTSPTPDLEAVRAALKAGDLDTIGELLGEDPALYDEKTPRWAARQRKEAKLIAERDRVVAQAETVVQRWSPVSKLVSERETNPAALFELVGLLTGEDPERAWADALRARGHVDPRVPALTKAVTEREERLTKLEAERAARADAAFHETLRDEVASNHQVRKLDGWEARVAEVLRDPENWDPDLGEPKLSPKQAADRVLRREREEYERRAKVFAEEPAPRKRGATPERAAGSAPAKVRKLSRDEWLAQRQNG